eukprot:scaffold51500_cov17-Tisochrysis_lutea.AAC.1
MQPRFPCPQAEPACTPSSCLHPGPCRPQHPGINSRYGLGCVRFLSTLAYIRCLQLHGPHMRMQAAYEA